VAVWAGSCGGLTYAGIVPEAVRIIAPEPPWDFKVARKIGAMPPSIPVATGTVGVPRLINLLVVVACSPSAAGVTLSCQDQAISGESVIPTHQGKCRVRPPPRAHYRRRGQAPRF